MIIPHVGNVKASTKLAQHVVWTTEYISIAIKALKMPSYIEVQDHGSCKVILSKQRFQNWLPKDLF
jgi:hypothetical protein